MKCEHCGCTDGKACTGGCSWIKPGVCSNCVVRVNRCDEELEAYLDDPNTKRIYVTIIDKDDAQCTLEIMKFNKKKKIVKATKSPGYWAKRSKR